MVILYDLEAIGENKGEDFMEIVEIAACKVDVQHGVPKIIDQFRTYVKPIFHDHISKKISKVVHFSMEDLKSGISYDDAFRKFIAWAGKNAVFVAWGYDDDMIYENNLQYCIYDYPCLQYLDLQSIYDKKFKKEKRTGLKMALEERGFDFDGTQHTALADAINLFPLWKVCEKEALYKIKRDRERYAFS